LRAYPAGVQSPAGGGREISVDVFAAEYYLGEVRLNPWSVSCARSPDGQIIAYLSQIADQVVRLGWSRLDNLADQKVYRGSVQPRSELTFAPDSRRLAFNGCEGRQCGVYIFDLDTGRAERIFSRLGTNLTWSPDGTEMAWISTTTGSSVPGIVVFSINAGEVTYFKAGNIEQVFLASPVSRWGLEMSQEQGLEGCRPSPVDL